MAIHSDGSAQGAGDANRRLVRFFSICLSSLVFVYSLLAMRIFIEGHAFGFTDWVLVTAKVAIGAAALVVVVYPAWLAGPLERQIDQMGALFEGAYADAATAEKIRMIVLVTMVSLLLELIMIRWLASVFPVFSFFKNFTLLACFLGLGAGYAVAGKAALRAGPRAADAGAVRRHHHAVALRHRRDHRSVLGPADAGADLDQHLDGQAQLAGTVRPERAALSPARHQLRAVRLHLLSDRPALRKAARQHRCAEGLRPQPDRQHRRRHRAVRHEPVLAAAGGVVHGGGRHAAVLRAGARQADAAGRGQLLPV